MKHFFSLVFFFWLCSLHGQVDPAKSEKAFTEIYEKKVWGCNENGEGTSGAGSSKEQAAIYKTFLVKFLADHAIKSVVDVGCGDWSFSKTIDWSGIDYQGFDVVKALIEKNTLNYGSENIKFLHADGVSAPLPEADLLICKDVLQHLPNEEISLFLKQLPKYKYVLITNDIYVPGYTLNAKIDHGDYRPVDLTLPPFSINGVKIIEFPTDYRRKSVLFIDRSPSRRWRSPSDFPRGAEAQSSVAFDRFCSAHRRISGRFLEISGRGIFPRSCGRGERTKDIPRPLGRRGRLSSRVWRERRIIPPEPAWRPAGPPPGGGSPGRCFAPPVPGN